MQAAVFATVVLGRNKCGFRTFLAMWIQQLSNLWKMVFQARFLVERLDCRAKDTSAV